MALAIFAMAGLRWYYALTMLGGIAAFLVHAAVGAQRWRVAIPVSALALLALSRAFLLGAGPTIPHAVRVALSPWQQQVSLAGLSGWLLHEVDARRDGFVRSGGATAFGADIKPADSPPAAGPPTAPVLPPSAPSATVPATVPLAPRQYVALGLDVRQVWIAHGAAGPGQRLALAVNRVRPASAANVAGVRPDDVVVAIGAHPVANVAELRHRAREIRPGTASTIDVLRDGQPHTLQVRRSRPGGRARDSAVPIERTLSLPPGAATAFGADIKLADSPPAAGPATAPVLPPSAPSAPVPATEDVALGLDVRQVWIADGAAGPGQRLALAVNRVRPASAADVAGVRPDDVVVAIDAHLVANVAELRQRVRETRPDTALTIDLIRDGQPHTLQVRRSRPGGRARDSEVPIERAFSLPPGLVSLSRWGTGLSVMFIPTSLQRLFGTSVVSGGRGLLALADIDTLFFDVVLVIAFATTVGHRRSYRNSVFVLALLLTLVIALPMIYTVTNFGTLFRLRGMVLGTAALLPLAASRRRQDAPTGASHLTTR